MPSDQVGRLGLSTGEIKCKCNKQIIQEKIVSGTNGYRHNMNTFYRYLFMTWFQSINFRVSTRIYLHRFVPSNNIVRFL